MKLLHENGMFVIILIGFFNYKLNFRVCRSGNWILRIFLGIKTIMQKSSLQRIILKKILVAQIVCQPETCIFMQIEIEKFLTI